MVRLREDRARESYVRWQKLSLSQLGSVVKLVLTLTGGAIAFGADLLVKHGAAGVAFVGLMRWSMGFLLLAAFFGLAVNLTRLFDFRWTRRAARMRQFIEENGGAGRSVDDEKERPGWVREPIRQAEKRRKDPLHGNGPPDRRTWRIAKRKSERWGNATWFCLYCQFALFFTGVVLLAIAVGFYPPPAEEPKPKDSVHVSFAPERPATENQELYSVQPGDTLAIIGNRKSVPWARLYRENQDVIGADCNRLTPGQKLKLPGGDDLASAAQR